VDLDLAKFVDRVNYDRLMGKIAQRVSDKRMLKLIRAFLPAGVTEDGLVSPVDEGTPQGGPLSPLSSNAVLDEWDRELERRGLRFARYADGCTLSVRSRRAGERARASVTRFPRREAQTVGKPAQERRGAAMGAEVCELQFYLASATAAADCAAGVTPVQGTSPGTDEPGPRGEHRTHGRGVIPLSAGLAGLFRAVSNAIGVTRSYGVDQAPASVGALEAVETKPGSVYRTSPAVWGILWRIATSPALALALSNAYLNSLGIPSLTGG
jgi:RNA-directed DNA polymerase